MKIKSLSYGQQGLRNKSNFNDDVDYDDDDDHDDYDDDHDDHNYDDNDDHESLHFISYFLSKILFCCWIEGQNIRIVLNFIHQMSPTKTITKNHKKYFSPNCAYICLSRHPVYKL